jgi:hypothetical protein
MSYFSQTINNAANGDSFMIRLKYIAVVFISFLFLLPVPWLVAVIVLTLIWHGLLMWSYKTPPMIWINKKLNALAHKIGRKMLKDERNSPYLFSLFGVGIFAPTLFILSYLYQSTQAHFNWWAVLAYHVLNYGPYFAFFSQIATLIHKEGHEPRGLFKKPFAFLNKFYGYFLAPLYGHVPEGYPMGHMRIHHKYNNAPDDVTSTVFYDRTQAMRFMIYLFEFMLFWTGISIAFHHYKNNRMDDFGKMIRGMLLFYGLIAVVMYFNFWFGFAYLLLPHLSAIIFLAAINYTWHAWTDPSEPKNIYKNSITIINGQYNVYNEDYHVEHHKRPQTHWEEYPKNYEKFRNEYAANRAIIFQDTQAFEVFFLLLFGDYDKMADKMVDLNNDMSKEDKIKLLKERLQPAH